MCAPMLIPLAIAAATVGASAIMSRKQEQPAAAAQQIQTHTPQAAPDYVAAPEAPVASPVMTTQGQGEAEDQQKATEQQVRKNRLGRNVLRIDRTTPNTSGLAGGSGINVPG